MSKRRAKKNGKICFPGLSGKATYRAIIEDYRGRDAETKRERDFYSNQPNLDAAIFAAATALTADSPKHDHQWRIPRKTLKRFADRLQGQKTTLKAATNFHELWEVIRDEGRRIKGIGELTVYDTAHRLGIYLRREPKLIYLHAGTRQGARALGLPLDAGYLRVDQLPAELQRLKPYEIEDCLCIYKDDLRSIRRGS